MAYTFNFELSGGINIYRQTDADTPVLYETWSPKAKVKIRVTDTTLSIIPIPASIGSERSEFYLKEAGGSSNNIFQIGGVTETGGLTVFAKRLTSEVFLDAGSGASTTLYNTLAGNSTKSDGGATPNYVSLYVDANTPTLQQVYDAGHEITTSDGQAILIKNSTGDIICEVTNEGDSSASLRVLSNFGQYVEIFCNRIVMTSPNGNAHEISVDNSGTIVVT